MSNRDFEFYNVTPRSVGYRAADAAETLSVKYEELGEVKHYFFPDEHLNHMVVFNPGGNKSYALYAGRRHNPKLVDVKSFEAYVKSTGGTITKPANAGARPRWFRESLFFGS